MLGGWVLGTMCWFLVLVLVVVVCEEPVFCCFFVFCFNCNWLHFLFDCFSCFFFVFCVVFSVFFSV